jgi:hypothetical protein
MYMLKKSWLVSLIVVALFLSACGGGNQEPTATPVDPVAIFTAAAQTVAVQQTETAMSYSPTPEATATPALPPTATLGAGVTPFATLDLSQPATPGAGLTTFATPTLVLANNPTPSGPQCLDSAFVADLTYADGSEVDAGKPFEKKWRVQNTGTCTWDEGFVVVQVTGDDFGDKAKTWKLTQRSDFTDPGDTLDIKIDMVAPSAKGEHGACWRMKGDSGFFFGTWMCVKVVSK